jgi:hypothetical protein
MQKLEVPHRCWPAKKDSVLFFISISSLHGPDNLRHRATTHGGFFRYRLVATLRHVLPRPNFDWVLLNVLFAEDCQLERICELFYI